LPDTTGIDDTADCTGTVLAKPAQNKEERPKLQRQATKSELENSPSQNTHDLDVTEPRMFVKPTVFVM